MGLFLDPRLIRYFLNLIYDWNDYFETGAIIVESFLAFAFFLNARLNQMILVLYIMMHILIFALTGIFFWKWILILGVLLFASLVKENPLSYQLDFRSYFLYIAMLLVMPVAYNTIKLSWFDSGFITKYTFSLR